ncbi:hypothetical protein ONA91_35310 [Micromonospora sp. DR5-3]|uniref:hypothetical protein n=1 Tax=Micromonospora sp. MP36 TaxID=2604468 RepID=UPI0021062F06|nr:hypothetical protein [Micromonospora sp. MP36]MCW3819719.1 hypothetical protein [Micromonospora sp. DR5-3]
MQCYAGTAPVTRRSGRSEYVVARRLAHNRYLGGLGTDLVDEAGLCLALVFAGSYGRAEW